MAAQLSYAPIVELKKASLDATRDLAGQLREKELPSCFIRRDAGSGLKKAIVIAGELCTRGILPVVEMHPGDEIMPLRNLVETSVLGALELIWVDGEPDHETSELLEIIDGAGRHRMPLDVQLRFKSRIPDNKDFKSLVRKVGELADKYGHIQVVKLSEIPPDNGNENVIEEVSAYFKSLLDVCPRVKAALSPSLWINSSTLRSIASDLGLVMIDVKESSYENFNSNELKGVEHLAKQQGLPMTARLPLVPRFYRKGWFAFEVGKVLDAWADRRVFRAYKDRPGWLVD